MPPSDQRQGEAPSTALQPFEQVVVVVDPYSTGCLVAKEIAKRGYLLIAVWTNGFSEDMKTHIPTSAGKMVYFAQVDEVGSL